MQTSAALDLPRPPAAVWEHVATLDRYGAWMSLVHTATPTGDPSGRPAWDVELRTRLGPLARSKRLRMVRTVAEPHRLAVFERHEVDGREHAAWILRAELDEIATGSRLTMHLSYGGSLWTGGVLQRILDDEIRRGSERLLELLSDEPTR